MITAPSGIDGCLSTCSVSPAGLLAVATVHRALGTMGWPAVPLCFVSHHKATCLGSLWYTNKIFCKIVFGFQPAGCIPACFHMHSQRLQGPHRQCLHCNLGCACISCMQAYAVAGCGMHCACVAGWPVAIMPVLVCLHVHSSTSDPSHSFVVIPLP